MLYYTTLYWSMNQTTDGHLWFLHMSFKDTLQRVAWVSARVRVRSWSRDGKPRSNPSQFYQCRMSQRTNSFLKTPHRPFVASYVMLYYTILYYTILYYTILYYTILYCTMLYYTILYYTILYCTILYYALLYYTILYYTMLYYTMLYYTMLYYTTLY